MADKGKVALYLPYEFENVFAELSDEEVGKMVKAIMVYDRTGEEPNFDGILRFAWRTHIEPKMRIIKENYERKCKQNKENVNKRWKRGDTENKQNDTNDTNVNDSIPNDTNVNDIDINIDIDRDIDKDLKEKYKKEKPVKHKHGQYKNVLLSDDELQKLQTEFPLDWQQRIENVSEYCASHGKTYKDYLATIRNWARRDKQKPVPIRKNDAKVGYAKAMQLLGLTEEDE